MTGNWYACVSNELQLRTTTKVYLQAGYYIDLKLKIELMKYSEKSASGVESSHIWFQSKSDFSPPYMT